jgi:hypothetical protein
VRSAIRARKDVRRVPRQSNMIGSRSNVVIKRIVRELGNFMAQEAGIGIPRGRIHVRGENVGAIDAIGMPKVAVITLEAVFPMS